MIALLQRVSEARVTVAAETVGEIGCGLLVFAAFTRGDGNQRAQRMLERILDYRVFPDGRGRMNRDLRVAGGGLLLVPQFTLAADTRKGRRPSFAPAAEPETARRLFNELCARAEEQHRDVASGRFGADMQVALVNDGPVTFLIRGDSQSAY
jgi:D-tyrosyl-tRNA(Tyr) deacylase